MFFGEDMNISEPMMGHKPSLDDLLRLIAEGTAGVTGEEFLKIFASRFRMMSLWQRSRLKAISRSR